MSNRARLLRWRGASGVSPSPWRRAWLQGAGCALALFGTAGCAAMNSGAGPRLGQPAPPLVLHTLDGRDISTTDLQGNVVILAFWATWCAPCREELPLLSDYAAHHAKDGLKVLGVSLDTPDNLPAVQEVARTLSFPVGLLGSDRSPGYGRFWRLPVSFTIDRSGRIADNTWNDDQGAWTEARLQRVVAPLLEATR
jgi:cytochrome c biogenesis protein CcmG/thiol:disulfide interchange protein DsbE